MGEWRRKVLCELGVGMSVSCRTLFYLYLRTVYVYRVLLRCVM